MSIFIEALDLKIGGEREINAACSVVRSCTAF